jgi:hypothetical protein
LPTNQGLQVSGLAVLIVFFCAKFSTLGGGCTPEDITKIWRYPADAVTACQDRADRLDRRFKESFTEEERAHIHVACLPVPMAKAPV